MRRLALVLVVAACGGKSSSDTTPPGNTGTSAGTVQPCPSDDELLADLRALQTVPPTQPETAIDACVPGRFGRPGWAIAARSTDAETMEATRFVLVVDTAHAMISAAPSEGIDVRSDGAPVELSVADLDGDGVDEVLGVVAHAEGSVEESYLVVWQLGEPMTSVGSIQLLYAEPDGVRCETSFTVEGAVVLVHTENQNDPDQTCEDPGEHRYELRDGALVQDP